MHRTTLRTTLAGSVAGLAALALVGAGTPVSAAPAAERAVAKDLLSPLSLAVEDGAVYYAQNFAGSLHMVKPGGKKAKTLYTAKNEGDEVGAVSVLDGVVHLAVSGATGQTALKKITRKGKVRHLADLDAYETGRNPDAGVSYGIRGLAPECAEQFPEDGMPPSYTGIVESHPYATATTDDGVYVADAAANAVFEVTKGKVRTVAVLPTVPVVVSAQMAEGAGMPECAVGKTYHFEPVPTDVEIAANGDLLVTTLPGGPEDGSMAGQAGIYRIKLDKKGKATKVKKVVGGLTSATGLAVSPKGDMYVAELFRGRIVKVKNGSTKVKTFKESMLPGDVEWTRKALVATTGVLTGLEPGTTPAGKVERFRF